jgi:hypothetical protein
VTLDEIAPFAHSSGAAVPGLRRAFLSADVLARTDGLFVARIGLDAFAQFHPADIDELATAVCMAAKAALGHVHDLHGPNVKSRRPRVSPGNALVVCPVPLEPSAWAQPFSAGHFSDAHLQAAVCILPRNARRTATPRNALVCLRRSYLKVFEAVQIQVRELRSAQLEWQKSFWSWLSTAFAAGVLATVFALAVVSIGLARAGSASVDVVGRFLFAVVLFLPVASIIWRAGFAFLRWERRQIRLLRSGVTFYFYSNPLNEVIRGVLRPANANGIDDFSDLQGLLESKANGEVHRATLTYNWLSLGLAGAALIAAIMSLHEPSQSAVDKEASPPRSAAISDVDCGYKVGPFPPGISDLVSVEGQSPEVVAQRIAQAASGRQLEATALLGSTDEVVVRVRSEHDTNLSIAKRRSAWVKDKLSAALSRHGLSASSFELNTSLGIERVIREPRGPERDVIVCVVWGLPSQGQRSGI